jgi:membrane-associated phospholipid phosphatase
VRSLVRIIGDWLPHGYGDAARQLGLFVVAELCYETVRGIAEGERAQAFVNGNWVIDVEQATGTFFEPGLQSALIDMRWLIDASNWAYMNSHFVVTTTFLVWLYLFRNPSFYFVRNMFLVAMGLALVGYALMPTAPPRMFPEEGFVDTINAYAPAGHDSALVKLFINPYAAIPSMHCAFALMIGISAAMIVRQSYARVLWSLYPLLVLFVVVVTANHFWLDAAAGALVAALAAVAAGQVLARVRPAVWSFRPATS